MFHSVPYWGREEIGESEAACPVTACDVWRWFVVSTTVIVVGFLTDGVVIDAQDAVSVVLIWLEG